MALTSVTLTDLFGNNAVKAGSGPTATLTVRLSELGSNNIDSTSPEDLTPEGIFLAILQKAFKDQSTDTSARKLDLARAAASITTRGGETVRAERYTITVYSSNGIDLLDPDLV